MENLTEIIGNVSSPNRAIEIMLLFIVMDIATGYLQAWKQRTINSSISRDGFIKKAGWFTALLMGVVINFLTEINTLILMVSSVCIVTEFISIVENLGFIGVKLPFLSDKLVQLKKLNEEEKE